MEPFERVVFAGLLASIFALSVVGFLCHYIIKNRTIDALDAMKLSFAAGIIIELGFILCLALVAYFYSQQNGANPEIGKDIFDSAITIVPPLITLVIGYYFGTAAVVRKTEDTPSRTKKEDHGLEK